MQKENKTLNLPEKLENNNNDKKEVNFSQFLFLKKVLKAIGLEL